MNITEFTEMLKEGAELAGKAGYANTYLSKEETEAAFDKLEIFCRAAVGSWGMPENEIRELVIWAQETIDFSLQFSPKQSVLNNCFIRNFYVAEKEDASLYNLRVIDTIDEALEVYFTLPADKGKVLGIQSVRGTLDFVECDKIIDDYTKLPSWNENEEVIKVASHIKFALINNILNDLQNQVEMMSNDLMQMEP